MKQRKQWLGAAVAAVIATGMIGNGAQAQPAPNNGGDANGGAPNGGQNMTPEQRAAAQQQRRDETLHGNLTTAGFTDKATQDAIVGYVDAYEGAKQKLRDTEEAKMVAGLRDKTTTDDQLTKLLTDFRTAAATLRDQRKAALVDLDGKIGYTKSPRLEAYLTMIGVVGDEASLLSEIGGGRGGRNGFGGRGARGGNGAGPGGAGPGAGGMPGGGNGDAAGNGGAQG